MDAKQSKPPAGLRATVARYRTTLARTADTFHTVLFWLRKRHQSPPPGAASGIGRLLWSPPQPLIHPDARMIVIFSQKSACTNVAIWFLHHLGHLKAARDFHYWPHEYRARVYYYSELYQKAYERDLSAFKVVRIVRDPYERAASCFRHALRYRFADAELRKRLGRRNIAEDGLSFSDFLDFLEKLDLADCDPHFMIQRHPLEDRLPVHHLINVSTENLFARLNEVEADLGLSRSDLAAEPWVKELRGHNRPAGKFTQDDDLYTRAFTRRQARKGPWPADRAFLTEPARARIARLYAADIKAYL
jgi:hypothetical protein